MDKDSSIGVLIIMGILAIALFGGVKQNTNTKNPSYNKTTQQKTLTVEEQKKEIEKQLKTLKEQVQIEEDKITRSQYRDVVSLVHVNRSTKPGQEYVTIKVTGKTNTPIRVTGWTLKSLNSGVQVTIPKGTYLFFTGMLNTEEDIYLLSGETMYLVTGISPNGASFKLNKCSGYLTQFQTFVPYIRNNCPLPRNEDLSSIPKLTINDACFDHIDRMSRCKIQTKPLPSNWSYECTNFIINKINYPSCINTHKEDQDFYMKEWRVYLKRSESIWKSKKENIVLYDSEGKIVDSITY